MPPLKIAIQKIRHLPPEQLSQVVQFIEFLEFKANESDETPTGDAIEGITQGLKEALNGQTLPLSQLWEDIDSK
ncbi:MAG: hypothetical protein AB8B95_15765 [Pseudohongiellaceae bacterium]